MMMMMMMMIIIIIIIILILIIINNNNRDIRMKSIYIVCAFLLMALIIYVSLGSILRYSK